MGKQSQYNRKPKKSYSIEKPATEPKTKEVGDIPKTRQPFQNKGKNPARFKDKKK